MRKQTTKPRKTFHQICKEGFKFSICSIAGFVSDYLLYTLLTVLTARYGQAFSVPFSNVVARICSASLNFTLNRKFVFTSSKKLWRSALEYGTLAALIMLLNTVLLSFLANVLGWDKYLAKLLTEITFFLLSFLVQRFLIFGQKNGKAKRSTQPDLGQKGSDQT